MAEAPIKIPDAPLRKPQVSPDNSTTGSEASSQIGQSSPSSKSCEVLGWVLRVFKRHPERIDRWMECRTLATEASACNAAIKRSDARRITSAALTILRCGSCQHPKSRSQC